jgi:hypothetical protein
MKRKRKGAATNLLPCAKGMSITQKRLELLGQNSGEAVQIKLLRDAKGEVAGGPLLFLLTEVKVRLTVNG